ncbi:MAG TPA: phenylacetic acid degradation protein PaaN [Bacteroidetes bacterium]|nr:phenylacetic acid degradation protein PaaN [Bacteroidota bacterium]
MSQALSLFQQHEATLKAAITAIHDRGFWTPYPEHPKAYSETGDEEGKTAFSKMMNENFTELLQEGETGFIGEEVSPYLQLGLGIRYPKFGAKQLIDKAQAQKKNWGNTDYNSRAGILIEALHRIQSRFFEIAYATMHTTGQSFIMSFQASGPHANDRALEALAVAYEELTRIPSEKEWVKPMGKFEIRLDKNWKAVPKGVSLVIGCSTFPTWNTVPGMFASLMTGNPVIVKPHPKAILPIAIVIAEVQKVLKEAGMSPDICQMAVDTLAAPITKELAEDPAVKLIDFTGSSSFGDYVESLPGKTVFTEKAGVNSCLIDSVNDLTPVLQNLAFAVSLYSGQMCTAPQNIFIPSGGVKTAGGLVPYEEVVQALKDAINGLVNHPKMGAGTLGGIQAETTLERAKNAVSLGGKVILASENIVNPEFEGARVASPALIEVNAQDQKIYFGECFGPVVFVIKTKNSEESLALMKQAAEEKGAITCAAYCTDEGMMHHIEEEMNEVFTPVSFNFTGAIFVNQHAAFSDFHVTGGNAAGNASFANPDFVNRRFVWVGNRRIK